MTWAKPYVKEIEVPHSLYTSQLLCLHLTRKSPVSVNMVCYWCVERQGRRQYFVYSSHDVIGRACPDILIRITVGSRISLRSLYPKAFENLNHDLLKVSLLWIINYNVVEAFVPLDCHSPSVFLLWCLGCCILLLNVFFNLKCLSLYIVFKLDYVFIVV